MLAVKLGDVPLEVGEVPAQEELHGRELVREDVDGLFGARALAEVLLEPGGRHEVVLEVEELDGLGGWVGEDVGGDVEECAVLAQVLADCEVNETTGGLLARVGWLVSR